MLNLRDKVTNLSIQQDSRFSSIDKATQDTLIAILGLTQNFRENLNNQSQRLIDSEHLEHSKTRAVWNDHNQTQLDTRVCQSILESLHFQTRTVRHETIAEAHQQTFEWIFLDPASRGKSWSHFGHWLKTGQGIYWINGKAGSGKSTSMKLLVEHKKTKEMLDVWSQGSTVEIPSFFFWASGNSDQRSQEGLLRSLLYDVLQRHPELVPTVFPNMWTKISALASNNIPHTPIIWSLIKLKLAFAILVSYSNLRMCFFMDGLDECDGDHEELAEYFAQLSCSTNVKLCLASRPWPAFLDTFRDRPGLRLQDLTRDDIERYIRNKVDNNAKMVLFKQKQPATTEKLIKDLIEKPQGVFLWATLVVRSLLKGLSNRSSLESLE